MATDDGKFYQGHRARLRQKFLENQLADYELLELMLAYAIPRRDVRPLARGLMAKYGGVHQIITADIDDLMSNPGVGESTAIFLKGMQRLMLAAYQKHMDERPIFHDDKILANYCRLLLLGKKVEEFHVLYLDRNRRLITDEMHSRGTSDWAAVYPREILKRALSLNACSVVMLHNHPTANVSFSEDDVIITQQVHDMLRAVDIVVYDHYLVSGQIVYSMRNMQLLK